VIFPSVDVASDFIDYPHLANVQAYQAAAALDERFETSVVDALAMDGSDVARLASGRFRIGAPDAAVLRRAAARGFDAAVVVVTPFQNPLQKSRRIAALLAALRRAAPRARLVLADAYVGGMHTIGYEAKTLLAFYPQLDGVSRLEPENALGALVDRLLSDRDRREVVEPRFGEVDLANAPWPAWERLDATAYFRFQSRLGRAGTPGQLAVTGPTLPLLASRGCAYRCTFCTSAPGLDAKKRVNRVRPLEAVERELARLAEIGARHVAVLDELANLDPLRFESLLDLLNASGLGYSFPNGLRADRLSDASLDRMAGRVGFFSISAESGSRRVLDQVHEKGLDPLEIERVARGCAARGLPLSIHFQIGAPSETVAEMNETLAFAARLHDEHGATPLLQITTPIPGTRLHAIASERGEIAQDVRGDVGPLFQTRSILRSADWTPDVVARLRANFETRLGASRTRKVVVNVTYRCNNRCSFCATGDRVPVDGRIAAQTSFLEMYRARGATLVDFDGGEPTLYEDLLPLVARAKDLGYEQIAVTTNGRRSAYPAYAKALVGSGVTVVLVSLHGSGARVHERMTCTPGSFVETMEGLKNLLRMRPRRVEVGVNVTLGQGNVDDLPALAAKVAGLGADVFNVQFLTPFGRASDSVAFDPARAAPFVREVIDRYSSRMRVQVINLPFCFLPGYERHVASDVGKRERDMVFVTEEGVDLYEYLATKRVRRPVCGPCEWATLCDGFYDFADETAIDTSANRYGVRHLHVLPKGAA